MNYVITLFEAPSRTDTVYGAKPYSLADFPKALQEAIDRRTNDPSAPKWFNFSTWKKYHDLKDYQGSSAIVLEYSKRSEAEWGFIADAVLATQFKCFVFDTIDGVALVFPIDGVTQNNDYTRALSILSEIIGQEGMIAEPGATYLVRPKKGAVVYEMGTDVIDWHELKADFASIPKDSLSQWRDEFVTRQLTRDITPPKPTKPDEIAAILTPSARKAQQAQAAKSQKSIFDSLYDVIDEKMEAAEKSAAEFREAVEALKIAAKNYEKNATTNSTSTDAKDDRMAANKERLSVLDAQLRSGSQAEVIRHTLMGLEFESCEEMMAYLDTLGHPIDKQTLMLAGTRIKNGGQA